jgi:hypothetical protein
MVGHVQGHQPSLPSLPHESRLRVLQVAIVRKDQEVRNSSQWDTPTRARIFKLVRRPEVDSKESIPPAYVAWRASTTTLFLLGSYPPQIV